MTIANDVIFLSLRNAGIVGVGQTPLAQDTNDAFTILNAWIAEINLERTNQVNRIVLPTFPDFTTDVPFWSPYEHVLLTSMAVRLRQIYSLPPVDLDVKLALSALQAFNAINLQQAAAPTIAADDGTGYGIVFLALRAAGRVKDGQGVLDTSQDVTDAHSLLNEMLDEWQRERAVRVIPGTLSTIPDLSVPLTLASGARNAIVLNLAVRLRDAFGSEISKTLADRADKALALLQAINLQQNPPPTIALNDGTGYGLIYLALRAAGRVTDQQGVSQYSQDVTDAASMLTEMLDEWQQQRTVRVIPGTLPVITDLTRPLTLTAGVRSAITLNLAVRLRDAFGAEVSKTLADRAAMALEMIQAINQQQIGPLVPAVPETVEQAIFLALRLAGRITDQQSVSQSSKDMSDAFSLLVMMLAQWQRKRWLVWNEQEISLVSTGANSYTIGPGQDFDVARPDKIQAAWVRLGPGNFGDDGAVLAEELPFPLGASPTPPSPGLVDIPLAIIEAKEDWATITLKGLQSIPGAVFYDSSFPIGQVYFWPVPPAATYELHLVVKASLPVYTRITDLMGLPPEYVDAVVNNLACRIVVASGGQLSPFLLGQAKASLEAIRLTNSQIPLLGMPAFLTGVRRGDVSSWAGAGLNQAWTVGGPSVLS